MSGASSEQIDTISTVLYATDILMNWMLNDPMFDPGIDGVTEDSTGTNSRWFSLLGYGYQAVKWKHVRCALGVGLGTVAGFEAGGLIGAIAGGWFGADSSGCHDL